MKKLVPILLGLFVLGPVHAQLAQQIPKYFGFYILNIPDFVWVEGASVQGEFKRYTGVLNMDNRDAPMFVSTTRDPVPLTLNQASSLLMMADAKKPFDLIGVEGKSLGTDGSSTSFFVAFYAEVNGRKINLIPTMTSDTPVPKGPQIQRPKVGPGSVGGKMNY